MGALIACPAENKETRAVVFIRDPLVTPRAGSVLRTMIVCGDCAGDDANPRKTLLAADGTCSECGGRSYVLASMLFQRQKGKEPDERDTDKN